LENNQGPIRIKDIAEKAQVSVGTVDRVLHNRGRVSEEVREKVKRIIKELNYEPNLIARTLGTNKTYRFAALIPDPDQDSYWLDSKIGIEKAFKEFKGYGIVVDFYYFDLNKVNTFLEKAHEVTENRPEGILVAPLFLRESLPFFENWEKNNLPYVLINTQISESSPLCYIGQDSYQSGVLAGKLIQYGTPHPSTFVIVHIAEDIANSAHLIKKEKGFRDYFTSLEEEGKVYKVISADLPNPNHISFTEKLDYLFAENPDIKGVFVTTSKGFEIASYFGKRGIKDLRLIGYDLLEKNLDYLNKGTIDFLINQNPKGQGYFGILSLTESIVFRKSINSLKYLPLDIISKENLKYYIEADN